MHAFKQPWLDTCSTTKQPAGHWYAHLGDHPPATGASYETTLRKERLDEGYYSPAHGSPPVATGLPVKYKVATISRLMFCSHVFSLIIKSFWMKRLKLSQSDKIKLLLWNPHSTQRQMCCNHLLHHGRKTLTRTQKPIKNFIQPLMTWHNSLKYK